MSSDSSDIEELGGKPAVDTQLRLDTQCDTQSKKKEKKIIWKIPDDHVILLREVTSDLNPYNPALSLDAAARNWDKVIENLADRETSGLSFSTRLNRRQVREKVVALIKQYRLDDNHSRYKSGQKELTNELQQLLSDVSDNYAMFEERKNENAAKREEWRKKMENKEIDGRQVRESATCRAVDFNKQRKNRMREARNESLCDPSLSDDDSSDVSRNGSAKKQKRRRGDPSEQAYFESADRARTEENDHRAKLLAFEEKKHEEEIERRRVEDEQRRQDIKESNARMDRAEQRQQQFMVTMLQAVTAIPGAIATALANAQSK